MSDLVVKEEFLEEFDGPPDRPCRVCAAGGNIDMVEIFGQEGCQRGLADLIHRYLPIQVDCCDELPLQVCVSCVLRLEGSHELSRVCAAADVTLRTLYLKQEQREEILFSPVVCMEDSFADVEFFGEPDTVPDTVPDTFLDTLCEPDISSQPERGEAKKRPVRRKTSSKWADLVLEEAPAKKRKVVKKPPTKDKTSAKRKKLVTAEKKFACPLCTLRFKNAGTLKGHCLRRHPSNCCLLCDKVLGDSKQLQRHVQETHGLRCRCCHHDFSSEAALSQHFLDNHPELRPFPCALCDLSFVDSRQLAEHKTQHLKTFQCHECGLDCDNFEQLLRHQRSHRPARHQLNCDICHKTFMLRRTIEKHMRQHVEGVPSQCDVCLRWFLSVELLASHAKKHHRPATPPEKRFVCNLCDACYQYRTELNHHLKNHKPGRWDFKCGICGGVFKSENFVLAHIKTHSEAEMSSKKCADLFSKVSDFQCGVCEKFCYSRHYLHLHMRSHREGFEETKVVHPVKNRPILKCGTCQKDFYQLNLLRNHMATHLTVKPFNCSVCGKGFSIERSLTIHMRMHTGERPFLCDVCGRGFTSQISVHNHKKNIHEKELRFFCSVCDKGFYKKFNCRTHEEKHKNENHSCETCHRSFKSEWLIRRHVCGHQNPEQVSCDICHKTYTSSRNLAEHKKDVHSALDLECAICGKKFKSTVRLRKHRYNVHTRTSNLFCEICNKSFKSKQQLNLHRDTHDEASKKFECSVCRKKFRVLGHLKIHQRRHTGEMPYKCQLCNRQFRHDTSLKLHMKKHEAYENGVIPEPTKRVKADKPAKIPREKTKKSPMKKADVPKEKKSRGKKSPKKNLPVLPDQAAALPIFSSEDPMAGVCVQLPDNFQCVEGVEIEFVLNL